ncbi:Coenzyme F420 hydrogenase/dehydrogenase, beta subunit C-terminal domain [Defluviimonas sp. WL0024]|uniref:Coenzyme F420 hydrogenase/dehydrogenase, beta subunit C-terminal domain n=1 Tax=Albidovulum salinarum TaxID=2984153 RepID=A0ABT2X0W1_9RHOB|nr:Coenzyme F420 hydrogenase/dehydrogenase, beta subunit C-terminal domain [Defluviimonas sp. WL0024]MCU9847572.1 Coenzyme F420 hydrogenase/dehydrogenase, beta subunit C-terminal domain [Defluviimonas sp. WL0024]
MKVKALTPEARLQRIVDCGLCIGCGLCQSVAGRDKVRVRKAADGELRPEAMPDLDDAAVDRIHATCPGTRAEGLPPDLAAEAPSTDPVWGPLHRIVLGWAAESAVRHEGSTAGVLTALGQYLLRSGRVDFVLHVRASVAEPTFGEAVLSRTEDEVLAGAGSRYGPTAPLINLDAALALGKPFALIAKPCDLNAVRNLAHLDERVSRLIRYWLTPVCGGYMPDSSLTKVLADRGIDRTKMTRLRYRGLGCPGPTTVGFADGSETSMHYLDFWGEDESAWSLPFRCKICPDGIGEGADIAAADTWPGASPDRDASRTDPGVNSLLIRTRAGMELIAAAVRDGALALGRDVDVAYMNDTQPHQVTKKRFVHARHAGLRDAGSLAPDCVGLRIEHLSAMNDPAENRVQRDGSMRRALATGRGGVE